MDIFGPYNGIFGSKTMPFGEMVTGRAINVLDRVMSINLPHMEKASEVVPLRP